MGYLLNPNACLHLLRPGRIVRVYAGDTDWHYGVLLRLRRIEDSQISDPKNYVADVMLCCAIDGNSTFPCSFEDTRSSMLVVPVPLSSISEISCLRITLPSNLKDIKAKKSVKNTLKSLMSKYPAQKLPQLDPLADFNVVERDTKELEKILDEEKQVVSRIEILEEKYGQGLSVQLREAAQLQNIASKKELEISRSPLKKFEEEFKQRKDVLRKLGHIDEDDTVTLKGRAASQIDTGDELLITELMFDGTFGSLDEHELASLLSCMVPVENSQGSPKLPLRLSNALVRLRQVADHIFNVSTECKLEMELDKDKYVDQFRPTLMEVVYLWSKGMPFQTVCDATDVFEGSIVRALRRLYELMDSLDLAAQVVGDTGLSERFRKSKESIRKGFHLQPHYTFRDLNQLIFW
eukprot:jgi/Picre1/34926/NNA_002392.t1